MRTLFISYGTSGNRDLLSSLDCSCHPRQLCLANGVGTCPLTLLLIPPRQHQTLPTLLLIRHVVAEPCSQTAAATFHLQRPAGVAPVVGLALLNMLPLLFGTGDVQRYLAVLGMGMALVQGFAARHTRGLGFKVI